jgi:hypothetical protein
MRLTLLIFPVSITLTFTAAAWAKGSPGYPCSCPQTSRGWLLFADSNTRTPDFWWEDEVLVQEISICPHGIQFRFVAEEGGNPHLVALVFANPLTSARLHTRPDSPWLCKRYAALRTALSQLLDGALEQTGRIDFQSIPLDQRPRIVKPWYRLALAWRNREVELRGYLDVYMTLLL